MSPTAKGMRFPLAEKIAASGPSGSMSSAESKAQQAAQQQSEAIENLAEAKEVLEEELEKIHF